MHFEILKSTERIERNTKNNWFTLNVDMWEKKLAWAELSQVQLLFWIGK